MHHCSHVGGGGRPIVARAHHGSRVSLPAFWGGEETEQLELARIITCEYHSFPGELPTRIRARRHSAARRAGQIDRSLLRMEMELSSRRPRKRPKWPRSRERTAPDATEKQTPCAAQTRNIKARKRSYREHEGSNGVPPARRSTALTVGRY